MISVISRGCLCEIDSAASIAAEVEEGGGGGVSLSVLRPYTAHCIKLVCMAVALEGSLF
ncbi:unnamed protein product [Staurois parvus]|uniref:Uncharacterized protein n=1 Tax=Staurois parvus TaxID=386267 RepID=A0ABN9AHA0_9NEOB|nr:unnamed protein product [Staurois parvus]